MPSAELDLMADDVFDLLQESIILRDGDGHVRGWNTASERLYGWDREAALGQPVDVLLQTPREAVSIIKAALDERHGWEGDVMRRAANGTHLTIQLKCTPYGSNQSLETGIDVTALRRLEQSLARAEHRYADVFQAMAVSFWELDLTAVTPMVEALVRAGIPDLVGYLSERPDLIHEMIRATRVVDINSQSVALFGRGDKQELLDSLEPYWPIASYPAYAASVVAAVQRRPHYAAEVRLFSIDGRELDVWYTACVAPDILAQGRLLVGIFDISADKRARRALEASEERYRSLFHFLPVAMIQLDRRELAGVFKSLRAHGIADLKQYFREHPEFYDYAANSIQVIEVNSRAMELFRASDQTQLLGPAARLWSEGRGEIQDSMAARFGGAPGFKIEMKIRTFDDQIRDVLYVAYFPEAFDRDALGLACLVDISDRVRAQAMLTQMQADFTHAARVSMLGELTASIAHEVNQPLGAILTNGEATVRWLNRPTPDVAELRSLATRTVADAQRAADIIRRIRTMASRGEPEQAPLAINSVVEEVMLFLNPELKRQDVYASLELAPALPDVMADRIQLQQVLTNLAVNAIQAMANRQERQLIIRTFLSNHETICAEIEDTGPGIPEDHLEQVFQSFFTTKDGGLGIGLAICRSIVEAHGGYIDVTNAAIGSGARFRFTMPALRA
jgi:PAS domain S-box-containing protein